MYLKCVALYSNLVQSDMSRVPVLESRAEYERLYKWSLESPAKFWAHMAQQLGLYFKQKVPNPTP